jgi:nicotinamide-nucleotide amidase
MRMKRERSIQFSGQRSWVPVGQEDVFHLTSVQVAEEMVHGALHDSPATVAIATTGLCGTEDVDGLPAGTVCFAWGFARAGRVKVFTHQHRFFGDRTTLQHDAAVYALEQLPAFHRRAAEGGAD